MPHSVILVAGSLHYDIMVETGHLPRVDETAVGSRWYPKFGGKGGNQAVSARRQGAETRMVGAVGADDFATFLRAKLAESGVDDRFVKTAVGSGSGMSVALMLPNGDYAATIVSGANLMISAADFAPDAVWADVGLLVLQNEMPEAANIAAAAEARRRGVRTVLNAAPCRPMSPDFTALVDILVVNAVEAEMMGAEKICNLPAAADAARKLSDRFESVVVTAGAQGLAAINATDELLVLPAEKVTVVSTHGAGDAFIGAMVARLISGATLQAACRAASVAAALHVAGRV